MKKIIFFFLVFTLNLSAQITGKVTDEYGAPLPYVNIYLKNTYTGTTSNDDGNYVLNLQQKGKHEIIFQYLGFQTLSKTIEVDKFPFQLDVVLSEEVTTLNAVILDSKEDPAYGIIRKTIAQRKENLKRFDEYTADFYSRGMWKVKDLPEKFMGMEIGDLDGAVDSTRSGIVYLSETISEIAYQKPDKFTEKILASKVSGNDNGFSFNSAQSAELSFYENTITFSAPLVSPIAQNAFSYYNYKLEGVFYEGSKLINKIRVIPKRSNDRVWTGFIYIADDDWQLYGTELSTSGNAMQIPFVEDLTVKQNHKFDAENDFWVKISQTISFQFGIFGMKGDGQFIAVYSNYDFNPVFDKRTFTNEVMSFLSDANKKDSTYWSEIRPVPLTGEEIRDYVRRDSLQVLRKSKSYLDSIDAKGNKFKIMKIISGYTYTNSFKQWSLSYESPLPNIAFNTVQGWNSHTGLNFHKWYDENRGNTLTASLFATYGLAEDRLRFTGGLTRNFNLKDKLRLSLSGGSGIYQFNEGNPISSRINTISTLFFERNYMKIYEKNFIRFHYSQEVLNGLHLSASSAFEDRKPLFNNTDYVTIPNKNVSYTSNNPLQPFDFETPAFERHQIVKTKLSARINFAQKYMTNPDMKLNFSNNKYPTLFLNLQNGISDESRYNHTQYEGRLYQFLPLGNKGNFIYNITAGGFIKGEEMAFMDYKHFNGNQTRIGTGSNYISVFNLLPYYTFSTNKSYFEAHLEHDFKGWVLGKIPGINQLNLNLVLGAHFLSTENQKPYSEFSVGLDNLGFGKFRMFRVDYVRSYHDDNSMGAFIFGLKFLGIVDR